VPRRPFNAPLLAVIVAMLFIASLTLLPGSPLPFRIMAEAAAPWVGAGRLAFALNVLLFVPLGAIGGWWRRPAILLLAGIVSLSIETAQFAIPGRSPNLYDLVANGTGALVGYAAAAVWRDHRWRRARRRAPERSAR
jgi:glycopeptide antibiotics resistance protein